MPGMGAHHRGSWLGGVNVPGEGPLGKQYRSTRGAHTLCPGQLTSEKTKVKKVSCLRKRFLDAFKSGEEFKAKVPRNQKGGEKFHRGFKGGGRDCRAMLKIPLCRIGRTIGIISSEGGRVSF